MSNKDWNGNLNSIFTTLGASNHSQEERESNDYYATHPIAIRKLLQVEKPYPIIWECACGEGHLSQALKEKGYVVFSSDLIDRGYKGSKIINFLEADNCPCNCDILTNPPYKYAKEFVLKALNLIKPGHKVYMFLKLTFLEGKQRYKELFSKFPPKSIYVFSERVLCAKGGNLTNIPLLLYVMRGLFGKKILIVIPRLIGYNLDINI